MRILHTTAHARANKPPARVKAVAKRAPKTACWLTIMLPRAPLPLPLPPPLLLPFEFCPPDPEFEPPELAVVVAGAEGMNVALGFDKQELAADATAAELAGALGLTVAFPEKSQD